MWHSRVVATVEVTDSTAAQERRDTIEYQEQQSTTMYHMGNINSQGAVFIYKDDNTVDKAWKTVRDIDVSERGIRGELHNSKTDFLEAIITWNQSVDPDNAYLCIYAHMGAPGLNCVSDRPAAIVSWDELADALPKGVAYLWLVGCESKECLNAWDPLKIPVRHRLLVTKSSIYWGPLIKFFALELSIDPITYDDQMAEKIANISKGLEKDTQYFTRSHNGFAPV